MTPRTATLILLALAGCNGGTTGAKPEAPPVVSPPPDGLIAQPASAPPTRDSILNALSILGAGFGTTRAAIVARLGAPVRSELNESANPNAHAIDTVAQLGYTGIDFIITKSGVDGQESIDNIRVTGRQVALPGHLEVFGSSRADLSHLLGTPDEVQMFGDTTNWGFHAPPAYLIQFYLVNDTLNRIRWVSSELD